MKINSKGQKSIPLEELKTFTGADKVETVDLIQENNLDRFEKKNRTSIEIKIQEIIEQSR